MLGKVIAFAAGAVVGSVATFIFLKKNEEYEVVSSYDDVKEKETFNEIGKKVAKGFRDGFADGMKDSNPEKAKYEEYANKYKSENEEEEDVRKPYVISPDEFDENGYDTLSLTYYADGVLTDDQDERMDDDDIEELIGKESLNHFGEYEDDSVFVRNDRRKLDIEILLDMRNYHDFHH